MTDPWKLTPRERELLELVAEKGSQKCAYLEMGIAAKTCSELMRRAKIRMGARTPLLAVLMFDRWQRSVV